MIQLYKRTALPVSGPMAVPHTVGISPTVKAILVEKVNAAHLNWTIDKLRNGLGLPEYTTEKTYDMAHLTQEAIAMASSVLAFYFGATPVAGVVGSFLVVSGDIHATDASLLKNSVVSRFPRS